MPFSWLCKRDWSVEPGANGRATVNDPALLSDAWHGGTRR